MTTNVEAIGLPFDEAIDFFRQKTRVPSRRWSDVYGEAHTRSFMVAGAASDALLSDFQGELQRAVEGGVTLGDFRKSFDTIVAKHGWSHTGTPGWRSRIIYETNLSTAYSAGRYVQQNDPDTKAVFPFWTYVHSGSRHPRLNHQSWNGTTLAADDPWWKTHYPPNGWRCGCRVSITSRAGLRRMGKSGPDQAPPLDRRPWTNPSTGETHQVPHGIDPGFDYNPGEAWQRRGPDRGAGAAPAVPPPAPIPGTGPASAEQLRAFLREPRGTVRVGTLPPVAMEALGTEVADVLLSNETMEKQREHHPDLTDADYLQARETIGNPDLILAYQDAHLHMVRRGRQGQLAVVKSTGDGGENYLVSLRRSTRPKDLRRMMRLGRVVYQREED